MNSKLSVIVGSTNPVKVNAVKHALEKIYPETSIECQGIAVPSGVSEQPLTVEETRLGAVNRVQYCQAHYHADFFAAIEGGVDRFEDGPATFAFVVLANAEHTSITCSASLPLPERVFQELQQGAELGPLMDQYFNTDNIKQKGGAIALLTNGLATRGSTYEQAVTMAMAPFIHPAFYR
uniref:inosine/xanthosine triphosphatase n=1 Tax=Thaumasiovibrio occultus TaxID=1891184 RepID=UPI00192D09AF|nr:inosine/xanthosine triphosphatase [Thaumasiovibrio occultus]